MNQALVLSFLQNIATSVRGTVPVENAGITAESILIMNIKKSGTFTHAGDGVSDQTLYLALFIAILFFALIIVAFALLRNKGLRDSLEEQTTTLSTIFKSIPDLLFCQDMNGRYTSCNSSFEKLAGCKESEIIGKTSAELFIGYPEMAREFAETDTRTIRENITQVLEEWMIYPDGEQRLMETVKTPLIQNDLVVGLLGISRDITEHKAAVEGAKAASNAKSIFLAQMSHEIRTPMNAITGMAELILRENNLSVVHRHAYSVKQASANLLSIINDILDLSKIEAGKLEIIEGEYSFVSLVNDVLSIIRMRISEKPLLLVANVDCNIPSSLIGDESRLRQVLLNILGNAVKYTNEGFVSLEVSGQIEGDTALLTIAISDSGEGIKEEDMARLFDDFIRLNESHKKGNQGTGLGLAITKNLCTAMGGNITVSSEYGVGSTFTVSIPQRINEYTKIAEVEKPSQKRSLVFEPRSIYADSIIRSLDNLGVSCTLVTTQSEFYREFNENSYPFVFLASFLFESAANMMKSAGFDSKLILMTELGEPISIPDIKAISMPAYSVSIANILNDAADGKGYSASSEVNVQFIAPTARILVVDDILTNLEIAKGLMAPYMMQIDVCMSGAEAIRMVAENRYDLIFMDHMMPEMDGVETTAGIRSIEGEGDYYQKIPIVALTANAVSGMKEMFLQSGMNDFLAKPIELLKLNNILDKWLPGEKREKYEEIKTVSVPEMFEIRGIDTKAGIAMTGGTMEQYLKILDVFYKNGLDKVNAITKCLDENDIERYTVLIHGIKSESASIGAGQISDLARTLEIAGRSEAITFIRENTGGFLMELKTLLQSIKDALPDNRDKTAADESSDSDKGFLRSGLSQLKDAFEDMDVREMNTIMNRLGTKSWGSKTAEAIENISNHILLFEYDKAIEIIDGLL